MVPRRQHTARKHVRLTHEGQAAVQAWADRRGISFSAALERLARFGLGQATDEAIAPALVSVVRHEVQRQMHRLASLLASNAIEAGVSARLSVLRSKPSVRRTTTRSNVQPASTPFIRSEGGMRSRSSVQGRT